MLQLFLYYSRDPNKRTGGNKRTGEKNLSNKINVQDIINVQGKIMSNSHYTLVKPETSHCARSNFNLPK